MLEGKLRISGISDESEDLVELFLDCYAQKSKLTYINAIRRLKELVDKQDFSDLNYADLASCISKYQKTAILTYIVSFFQFLYCNDHLVNAAGFENLYWNKKERKEYFDKLKTRIKKEKKDYKPSLSLADIEKLITFCDQVLPDDVDNLRLSFCFHLIFFEGISISALRGELDANNYMDGYFKIGDQEYLLIDKYISLFEHLKNRTYSKFSTLNHYIISLGKKVGIADLTPQKIKSARKNCMFMCPECGERHLYFVENWISINNKIVCSECAEKIIATGFVKKNDSATDIELYEIDIINRKDKNFIRHATSTFNKLINEISLPTNFEELEDYLEIIGKLGEKYVYEKERERLRAQGSEYWELVDDTPASDNRNGYDILSYTENGEEIFIEVKATTGNADKPFYISNNELQKAKETYSSGGKYQIHRVCYVANKDKVSFEVYEFLDEKHFIFDNVLYKATKIR